jgi:histidine triad (HIT) family protein
MLARPITPEQPMSDTIFGKILRGEIPADFVYEDKHCVAFHDINAQAPTHILVIPRKAIPGIYAMEDADVPDVGHLFAAARDIARQRGLEEGGYRLVINSGAGAGQTVFHLHVHLLAGRPLSWPPG